jgi:uncharacterized protein YlzI (FlbEa/FlbD family)
MKGLITLTIRNSKRVVLNSSLIQSIEEMEDGSIVYFGFGSEHFYRVTETIEEILKLIDKSDYLKIKTY